MRRFLHLRRRPEPPRADRLAIAVMEYEELGIEPKAGTAAALVIGLRSIGRSGTNINHKEET